MSYYPSAELTDERLHQRFEDQSSTAQFNASSQQQQQQQQTGGLVLPNQVPIWSQHHLDYRTRVDDGWQQQCDHRTSNTLANASWRQHETDSNTEGECHPSNAQLRDMHQRPFSDLNTSSQPSGGSQLRQFENQDSTAQLPGGWPVPKNDSAVPDPVRLPTFIYREPLPPYVPDESSPVPYHGKVVPPERLGSYFLSHQDANSRPRVYPHMLQVSNFTLEPKIPPPPRTYMAWSIVSMLCCCLPLGIAALVYSSAASTEYAAGRYDEAQKKSIDARSLNIAATALGILVLVSVGVYNGIIIANARAAG